MHVASVAVPGLLIQPSSSPGRSNLTSGRGLAAYALDKGANRAPGNALPSLSFALAALLRTFAAHLLSA